MNKKLSFSDKFKKGFLVALKSFTFVWHHKKLLFFPFLTASLVLSTIAMYDVVYYQLYHQHITSLIPEKNSPANNVMEDQPPLHQPHQKKQYSAFLLFGYLMIFTALFFSAFSNVALSYAATQAFTGSTVKLVPSLRHSMRRIPTLLVWAFSAFLIHMLINIFKNRKGNGVYSLLIRLFGVALELVWYIATFLVIPVIAHENDGAFKSIQRSAQLIKKTFGESLAPALLFQGQIFLIWILICAAVGRSALIMKIDFKWVLYLFIPFFFVTTGIMWAIVSTATTIFQTAVYHYAIGNPVGPFKTEDVQSTFIKDTV